MVAGYAAHPHIVLNFSARVSVAALGEFPSRFYRRGNLRGVRSRMVHRPIRLGSLNSASLFQGAPCVCVHGGHGRPYGVACCGRQTVQQQRWRRTHTHRYPSPAPPPPRFQNVFRTPPCIDASRPHGRPGWVSH